MESAGFREIAHTADWSVEVWAPDYESLLRTAAKAMFSLMNPVTRPDVDHQKVIEIQAGDAESLLILFLNELLYFVESEQVLFECVDFHLEPEFRLKAVLAGRGVLQLDKLIKAVTFHEVNILPGPAGLTVKIVFDV